MRKILTAITLVLALVTGCAVNSEEIDAAAKSTIAAAAVTVPVPIFGRLQVFDQNVPSAMQVSSSKDSLTGIISTLETPINVVPAGGVLTKLRVRVKGSFSTQCQAAIWLQNDALVVSVQNTGLSSFGTAYQTISTQDGAISLTVDSLSNVFFSIRQYGPDSCYVAGADVTYTPAQ
jgi:hypothetical protein